MGLTDPAPASIAGHTVLLALLLPHLHTGGGEKERKERFQKGRKRERERKERFQKGRKRGGGRRGFKKEGREGEEGEVSKRKEEREGVGAERERKKKRGLEDLHTGH